MDTAQWALLFSGIATLVAIAALILQFLDKFRQPSARLYQDDSGPPGNVRWVYVEVLNNSFISLPVREAGILSKGKKVPFDWVMGEEQPSAPYSSVTPKERPPRHIVIGPRDSRRARRRLDMVAGEVEGDEDGKASARPYAVTKLNREHFGEAVELDLGH